jgi:sarcosine oxidase/L-pipecolate oxidase
LDGRDVPRVRTPLPLPFARLNSYCRSGVLLFGSGPAEYTTLAYENDRASGARVQRADSPSALRALIPPASNPAPLDGFTGYLGEDGGWVESGRALELLTAEVVRLGGQIMPGAQVASVRREDGVTKGVACEDGRTFDAEKVVLAAGAWTAATFEGQLGMGLEMRCLATGWDGLFWLRG